jgi:putative ABC transport system permease protein
MSLADTRPAGGGAPALRAVVRWAWRLFRREWRQQFLILALITVAVGATIVGSAVATDTPPASNAGFGTAQDAVSFTSYGAHAASVVAGLEHRFGKVELIENETEAIPGSIDTYQLRAQDPHGPFSGPMLSLLSGRFPAGDGEVDVTSGVAAAFHLSLGDGWRAGGVRRRVVGIVENPQSLLEEFVLVAPGQVTNPTSVTALFDAPPSVPLSSIGNNVQTPATVAQSNPFNPETISLAALVLGMLLITLVSVGASPCWRGGAFARSGCSRRPAPPTATCASSSAPRARSSASPGRSSASSSDSPSGSPTGRASSRAPTT